MERGLTFEIRDFYKGIKMVDKEWFGFGHWGLENRIWDWRLGVEIRIRQTLVKVHKYFGKWFMCCYFVWDSQIYQR